MYYISDGGRTASTVQHNVIHLRNQLEKKRNHSINGKTILYECV